ncbi:MAG: hypothetical protein JO317_01170, partial [Verrucomicrobiae bacterium]|nr:hypothetical protein [Verrucomicrobiae bacterium]
MAKPFRLQAPWLAEADATSKGWVTVAAALLFWLIAWLDYAVGYEISLQVFYLIPIVMVAWFVGRWIAMVLSVSSAAAWAIGSFAPKTFVAHPLIVGWNALMALGFSVVVA